MRIMRKMKKTNIINKKTTKLKIIPNNNFNNLNNLINNNKNTDQIVTINPEAKTTLSREIDMKKKAGQHIGNYFIAKKVFSNK